ncbi:hypothetical protein Droror1_Dr00009185 [Drosera rotundifolia]
MEGKKFKHYWDLYVNFSKNRATEKEACRAADGRDDLVNVPIDDLVGDIGDGIDDVNIVGSINEGTNGISSSMNEGDVTTVGHSEETSSQLQRGKKRPRTMSLDQSLIESFEKTTMLIKDATAKFTEVFCTDLSLNEERKNINAEMSKLHGLSSLDRHWATRMLACDVETMVLFFTVEDWEKEAWLELYCGATSNCCYMLSFHSVGMC